MPRLELLNVTTILLPSCSLSIKMPRRGTTHKFARRTIATWSRFSFCQRFTFTMFLGTPLIYLLLILVRFHALWEIIYDFARCFDTVIISLGFMISLIYLLFLFLMISTWYFRYMTLRRCRNSAYYIGLLISHFLFKYRIYIWYIIGLYDFLLSSSLSLITNFDDSSIAVAIYHIHCASP